MADDIRRGIWASVLAVVFAASPAYPQQAPAATAAPTSPRSNDACPGGSSAQLDANGARRCASDDTQNSNVGATGVYLPDLLIDLFPNPAGRDTIPVPIPNPRRAGNDRGGPSVSDNGSPSPRTAPPVNVGQAAPLSVAPRAIAGDFVPDEVLATVTGDGATVQAIANDYNLQIRSQRTSDLLGATFVRFGIPDGRPVGVVLAQLEADTRTQRRAPNHVYQLQQAAGIGNYAFQRIALDADDADGGDIRVGVIDTAIDEGQPALAGVIAANHDSMPDTPMEDRSHATSVIGLIAGVGPYHGMAPGAKVYHARAFEGGRSTMDIILDALDWTASQDVRVINMSFVGPSNDLLELACKTARARGIVLVAAAGNNGPKAPYGYPAAYGSVIAVTATDENDRLMQQANRGAYVYVAAPGVDMLAPVPGGTDLVTGTSFASAIVSGAIADLLHARPDASAAWVEKTLASTASDLGAKGRDNDFGYGLINYKSLVVSK